MFAMKSSNKSWSSWEYAWKEC